MLLTKLLGTLRHLNSNGFIIIIIIIIIVVVVVFVVVVVVVVFASIICTLELDDILVCLILLRFVFIIKLEKLSKICSLFIMYPALTLTHTNGIGEI